MSNSTGVVGQIPGFPGTWDDVIAISWATKMASVASAALLAFDVLLTLEQEVRLVWARRRCSVPVLLYFLNRYGTMLQACLNVVTATDRTLSLPACERWNLFWFWCIPGVMAVVQATLTLRVTALWEHNRRIAVSLWIWYFLTVAVMCTMMGLSMQGTYPAPSPAPELFGCIVNAPAGYYWQMYLSSLVYEVTIAGLTLWKAVEHKRLLSRVPLLYVLIRDGFFYFFIVFGVMAINLVLNLSANALYWNWTPQLSLAIASCVSVRLFLNLREVACEGEPETGVDSAGVDGIEGSPRPPTFGQASTPWTTQTSGT